jgi:nicotinamide riboside transporter PnuC
MIDMIGYVATALQLFGVYLNTKHKIICWTIWTISNVIWITYGILAGTMPVIVINICFAALNVYGFTQWRKKK